MTDQQTYYRENGLNVLAVEKLCARGGLTAGVGERAAKPRRGVPSRIGGRVPASVPLSDKRPADGCQTPEISVRNRYVVIGGRRDGCHIRDADAF
jgi:hypothetical protein